jgi:SET domain-containing protein
MEGTGENNREHRWVEARPSPIHGWGLFARADIPAGTPVIEYLGEKITKPESLARCEGNNEYIFSLDEQFDLDGNVPWNLARFANHSCAPNCTAEHEAGRIWITATRPIRAGEEITFDYGYDLVEYREHPCRCGAPGCAGYIVAGEFHPQLKRILGRQPEPKN